MAFLCVLTFSVGEPLDCISFCGMIDGRAEHRRVCTLTEVVRFFFLSLILKVAEQGFYGNSISVYVLFGMRAEQSRQFVMSFGLVK